MWKPSRASVKLSASAAIRQRDEMRRFDVAGTGRALGRDIAAPAGRQQPDAGIHVRSPLKQRLALWCETVSMVCAYAAVILAAAPFGSIDPGWSVIWVALLASAFCSRICRADAFRCRHPRHRFDGGPCFRSSRPVAAMGDRSRGATRSGRRRRRY